MKHTYRHVCVFEDPVTDSSPKYISIELLASAPAEIRQQPRGPSRSPVSVEQTKHRRPKCNPHAATDMSRLKLKKGVPPRRTPTPRSGKPSQQARVPTTTGTTDKHPANQEPPNTNMFIK